MFGTLSFVLFHHQVSSERQAALTRLCTGRAVLASSLSISRTFEDSTDDHAMSSGSNGHPSTPAAGNVDKKPTAEVEGINYKVVWSCLLLVEMIMTNLSAASHFQSLAANAVAKVAELLRLFNTRTTQLVLGAGAIHSAARLKSINAKHLSLVTQCLGMMLALLPHIRAALMAQLPQKQHTLLADLDKIKKDYLEHNEKVLNKFVTIIGGIVEHGLAPRMANTNFDARARDLPLPSSTTDSKWEDVACCVFLEGVSTNIRKMHHVLHALLPPDHLQDVFSRIFAYVDQKVPALLIAADAATTTTPSPPPGAGTATGFHFPTTNEGKHRLLLEVECMTNILNGLPGVLPWDFTAISFLERKLEYQRDTATNVEPTTSAIENSNVQALPISTATTANSSTTAECDEEKAERSKDEEKQQEEKEESKDEEKQNEEKQLDTEETGGDDPAVENTEEKP